MSGIETFIQRRSDKELVSATVLEGMAATDLLVVENEWRAERSSIMQELLAAGVARPNWPESLHWDWSRKVSELQLLASTGFGIVCEKRWQGVMMTKSAGYFTRLDPDKGKPLLYLDYLEVAPWNWVIPQINRAGFYKTVGSTLFWRAVHQSEEEGFHGRLGLHALPQAEPFYEKVCRMTPIGRDASKQNLLYFELTRQQAAGFLKTGESK